MVVFSLLTISSPLPLEEQTNFSYKSLVRSTLASQRYVIWASVVNHMASDLASAKLKAQGQTLLSLRFLFYPREMLLPSVHFS